MTQDELKLGYSNLTKEVQSVRTLGELLKVIAKVNTFKKLLPSEYLWMVDRLNEQANQKKNRLIAFNDYLNHKKATAKKQ